MRCIARVALALCLLIPVAAIAQPSGGEENAPPSMLIEDFEHGIGEWRTGDDGSEKSGKVTKCAIYAVSGAATDDGSQCGRVEFYRARSGWASVSLPVDGRSWAEFGCSAICFWLRGDGSGEPVRVVLRVQTSEPERDDAYSQVIRVDSTDWELFSLRSFGFKNTQGQILQPGDIQHIKLLQFAKNGGWGNFRFRLDNIAVEAAPGSPAVPKPADTTTSEAISYTPDFGKSGPYALTQIGLNLGAPPTVVDSKSDDVRSWAYAITSDLGPSVVRVQLADYFDAASATYDLSLLDQHLNWIARCNCKPMVCLNVPPPGERSADERQELFAEYLKAVRAVVAGGVSASRTRYYEIFDEPLVSGLFEDVGHVLKAYNGIAQLIEELDRNASIGGPGFSSAWDERLEAFLKGAKRVDFLSFHFYGTHNVTTDSGPLFEAAYKTRSTDLPHQLTFQEVKRLAKQVRTMPPEIFITEFGLNSSKDKQGRCRDERAATAYGAAWLAACVLTGTPYADKVLHYQLKPGGWGTINLTGSPDAPYWGAWLLKNYAPRGSVRQDVALLGDMLVAGTFQTGSSHNVVIAYAGTAPVEIVVNPSGIDKLLEVRERRICDSDRQWKGSVRPKQVSQRLAMDGPGVFVLQYIPQK